MKEKIIKCLRLITLMLVSVAFIVSGVHFFGKEIVKYNKIKEMAQLQEQQNHRPYVRPQRHPDSQHSDGTESTEDTSTEEPDTEVVLPFEGINEIDDYMYDGYFNNMLFIGDSRTQSFYDFGKMDTEATFFCKDGMTIYGLGEPHEVPSIGTTTLVELLSNNKYDRIYLMIGINELGGDKDRNMKAFKEWVEKIMLLQPDTQLVIQSNLHVTKKYSMSNEYENNVNLNYINSKMKEIADEKGLLYIDCNELFDDDEYCLNSDLTFDGVHPKALLYRKWAAWLAYYVSYK